MLFTPGCFISRASCTLLGLQLVSLVDPVAPILNRLLGLLIHFNTLQLHQGNRKLTLFPPNQHEHFMQAFLVWSHSHDLDFLSQFQRRDRTERDTAGRKWEVQGSREIRVPS